MPESSEIDANHIRRLAEAAGLSIDAHEAEDYAVAAKGYLGAFDAIPSFPEPAPPPPVDRPYRRPTAAENPLGAWSVVGSIRESETGRLAGRTIAVKDNTCVAGLPLTGGASMIEDFVPDEDAIVVSRVLAEGAELKGVAVCEYFSASGGSHTSASARVHNPHKRGHTSGGSSSGCGALVGAGEVDLALGCDQGGSIRVPSSYCGIVGLKPTWGLVPYTGILSIDAHIDHVGPMTRTVEDNALLLEVIAGPDGTDNRQAGVTPGSYTNALDADVAGLRVGLVQEGFAGCDPAVADSVREAAERLRAQGAIVSEVSIPEHLPFAILVTPFLILGAMSAIVGGGYARQDLAPIPRGLPEAFAAVGPRSGELPPNVKAMWLAYAEIERSGNAPAIYARAKRQRQQARAVYDDVLTRFDALLMPTTTMVAPPICEETPSVLESFSAIGHGMQNTAQFDVTGHPALSVPCGTSSGLPVGAMLIGRHFEETVLYRLARGVFDEGFGSATGGTTR
ncbi:MAG: amidase [Myxococcota bacterium]